MSNALTDPVAALDLAAKMIRKRVLSVDQRRGSWAVRKMGLNEAAQLVEALRDDVKIARLKALEKARQSEKEKP
jgi:predicted metal-dependent hydrolase